MFIWYYFDFDSPIPRFPEEWLSIPHSPRNEKIAFLDSPIPRGMQSAGEFEHEEIGVRNPGGYEWVGD